MKNKIIAALAAAVVLLCGTSAYANSSSAPQTDYSGYSALDRYTTAATPTPKPSTGSRVITPNGNGHIVDNVDDTDSEKLQFITVTAKDGSVFYVVIDKQNSNDNVYFLNTVDVSDLEALTDDYTPTAKITATPTPEPSETSATPTPEPKTDKKQKQEKQPISGNLLILIMAALAAVGIGIYYVKVIIPKKKLEDADDLEDFDFEDTLSTFAPQKSASGSPPFLAVREEVINEDDIYSEDDTDDSEYEEDEETE